MCPSRKAMALGTAKGKSSWPARCCLRRIFHKINAALTLLLLLLFQLQQNLGTQIKNKPSLCKALYNHSTSILLTIGKKEPYLTVYIENRDNWWNVRKRGDVAWRRLFSRWVAKQEWNPGLLATSPHCLHLKHFLLHSLAISCYM